MPLIEWSNALSVGFDEIDKDHEKLVGIINNFNEAIEQKKDKDDLEEHLDDLIEYTSWHFRHEERLMQGVAYPKMEQHQQIHRELATKAVEIQKQFGDGDDSVLDVLIPFLKDWLTNHILVTDKELGTYLAAQE
ncbi:bacteriohemerythrin [Pseudodesulfovibrio sp.]|nr:bacteriohemerythrin [Pseudodesulfovibrio sp.]